MTFKPMLAAADPSKTRFPVYASCKVDGIRAMVRGGVVVSRTLRAIPNAKVQKLFGLEAYEGFDGELAVGPANASNLMQETMSGVMRRDGEPDVTYHVFDLCGEPPEAPFVTRLERLICRLPFDFEAPLPGVRLLQQTIIHTPEELEAFEAACLAHGFEGAMVRAPEGPYKHGRATAKEGWLSKLKRFTDAEATVIGFLEREHNENEATVDELGRTKRSTHAAGKRPAGDLGALVCRTPAGVTFNLGTGFTAAQRVRWWAERESLVGLLVTYKSFTACGVVTAPRIPVFRSFRSPLDLDA